MMGALVLGFALTACQKEQSEKAPSATGEKVPVTISVSDFLRKLEDLPSPTGRQSGIAAKDPDLHTKVSHIYYYAFSAADELLVDKKYQTPLSAGTDFGVIKDTLAPGTYKILLVASVDPTPIVSQDFVEKLNLLITNHPTTSQGYFAPPLKDQFFKVLTIVVPTSGEVPQANATLERYISKLEVRVLDAEAVEADNKDVVVTATKVPVHFGFSGGAAFLPALKVELTKTAPNVYSGIVLPSAEDHLDVLIQIKERGTGSVLHTKTVSNVQCFKNKATILSGNVLSVTPSAGDPEWHLLLQSAWEDPTPIVDY